MTNVRWSADDKLLVSTGGADTAVMVWQCSSAADRNTTCGESDDSDTDSEEEGGKEKFNYVCYKWRRNSFDEDKYVFNGMVVCYHKIQKFK